MQRLPVTLTKKKLTLQIIGAILLCSFLITLLITAIQLYADYHREMRAIRQLTQQIETSHLPSVIQQLWVGDFDQLRLQLQGILRLAPLQYAEIRTEKTTFTAGVAKSRRILTHAFPLQYSYKAKLVPLGTLYLEFDLDALYQRLAGKLLLILGNQALVIFCVSVFVFFIFQRLVMRHLHAIAAYTRQLDLATLDRALTLKRPAQPTHPDELEDVVNGMNTMRRNLSAETQKITTLNHVFQKFVPRDFLDHLDKQSILDVRLGDSVERQMAILFSDIRAFTALSETMTPAENFRFLNEFFSRVGPIIREHAGFIDKYIGDAIMALFDQETDQAVLAGIGMLHKLQEYNLTRNTPARPLIRMGIGIHAGTLMLGTIGEQDRMETTVISDAVNTASRLEGMTKMYGGALLISEAVYQRLLHPETFAVRQIDRVQAKGKTAPMTILEVFNADPPAIFDQKAAIRRDFEAGMACYQQQALADAQHYFESCLRIFPDDQATQLYLQRCAHYRKIGWDDAWDGITRLDSK